MPTLPQKQNKRKVLVICDEWLAPSLTLTLQNEGCDIVLAEKRHSNILKGTIRRIPYADRLEYAKDCDLVIYEDKSNRDESKDMRATGKSVIGGSKLVDKLELDRMWGNKIAKECGMLTPEMYPMQEFTEISDFIKERGGKWVLKQCGQIDEIKGLNFVAKMPNSEDLLDFLPILEKNWVEGVKKDFVLQEKIDGHEMAIGSFWNGTEFMKDKDGDELCEENWEHKPLFPGGLGESCYDEETEVLTNKGFKYFKDLDKTELIAQVDQKTLEISYVKPLKYYKKFYEGDMYHFKSREGDILTTPNHWMFISHYKKNDYKLVQAQNVPNQHYKMLQSASWRGKRIDKFIFPEEIVANGGSGKLLKKIEMDGDLFCKFLGIYIAEGSTTKEGKIYVSQIGENIKKIRHLFNNFPLHFRIFKQGYVINSVQLSRWLKRETGAYAQEKHIPEIIKNASPEQLRIFLDAFNLGDGDIHGGQKRYCSTSKKLIDDIQEILIKLGIASTITEDENQRERSLIAEKYRKNCVPLYSLEERKNNVMWCRGHKKIIPYKGFVYCVKVPTHLLVVRRNGRVLICGNTGEQYTVQQMVKAKYSKLFSETLDKCRELLKQIDYRGDFDVNTIVTEKGAYFLEFTPRMGVPATSGMLEMHKSSWYDLLKAMADGKQPKNFEYDPNYCIVSWLYTKPFPFVNSHKMTALYENAKPPEGMEEIADTISFRMSNSEGIIVNFKPDFTKEDWTHIHPDGLRFQDGRLKVANPDGYVLTATQMGKTVEEAGEKLNELLKKIIVPKGFWRNDFDKTNYHLSKDDLTKWGYIFTTEELAKKNYDDTQAAKKEDKRKKVRSKLKEILI